MSLLIKSVRCIGLDSDLIKGGMDIAINSCGIVEDVGFNLEDQIYDRAIDASTCYLSAGWIDLHSHVFHGISNLGVRPDDAGPRTGVTSIVDAGSSGEATFAGFKKYIIDTHEFPIFAFLNIGSLGLIKANDISELSDLKHLDIDSVMSCIEEHKEYIKGIKLRASGLIWQGLGTEVISIARHIADEVGLPLMVHVGEPPPLLVDILKLLDEGDIVTHCYHGKRWGIVRNGEIIPELLGALDRGVRLDVGHGEASFNFSVAERAVSQGIAPFSISTDLHTRNLASPVYDLPTTMSKLLGVGLSLSDVIRCVSENPCKVVGLDDFQGGLKGNIARFTLFTVEDSDLQVTDANGNTRLLTNFIRPRYTILGSNVTAADTCFPIRKTNL